MTSPFPGMDPYLEGSLWSSVHAEIAVEIARELTPRLRPRYLAFPQRRFVLTLPDTDEGVLVSTSVYPDAAVADFGIPASKAQATAVSMVAPVSMATVMPESIPVVSVEIRDVAERRLVTAIEVLSPANKASDGRDEYLERRRKFLLSTAHLIEIDLLRRGHRIPMTRPLPAAPYYVFVGRTEKRPLTQVWPIRLRQALPTVPVPLLSGDPDVPLDLQRVVASIYESFGYDAAIDYSTQPEIPLSARDAGWARRLVRNWKTT